jgi:hypothetical protein
MRATVPTDVGFYSYAESDYANPHAVTSIGGTTHPKRSRAMAAPGQGFMIVGHLSAATREVHHQRLHGFDMPLRWSSDDDKEIWKIEVRGEQPSSL